MKTCELIGTALDWAVARAERRSIWLGDWLAVPPDTALRFRSGAESEAGLYFVGGGFYSPSTIWAQGGPIIEWEEISIGNTLSEENNSVWQAYPNLRSKGGKWGNGSTPLIAAMRCFVANTFGDVMELPYELSERI